MQVYACRPGYAKGFEVVTGAGSTNTLWGGGRCLEAEPRMRHVWGATVGLIINLLPQGSVADEKKSTTGDVVFANRARVFSVVNLFACDTGEPTNSYTNACAAYVWKNRTFCT